MLGRRFTLNEKLDYMSSKKPSLEEVFSPRGVAVVGASPTGNTGFVRGLMEAGCPAIYPVNPNHTEVLGLPCYPNLQAIPGVVDHVVVSIPAESALDLLDDCAAKGVRSVHFFTAGFSETGRKERADMVEPQTRAAMDQHAGDICLPGDWRLASRLHPDLGRLARFVTDLARETGNRAPCPPAHQYGHGLGESGGLPNR